MWNSFVSLGCLHCTRESTFWTLQIDCPGVNLKHAQALHKRDTWSRLLSCFRFLRTSEGLEKLISRQLQFQ